MMLNVYDLNFDYSDKPVLRSVNFHVNAGGFLHLRGANGSGKSTLMKMLAGLLHPVSGEIHYGGQNIANDLQNYRQALCYIGHKNGVSSFLTPREHYQFELQKKTKALPFDVLIERLSLNGQEDVLCGLLSAGQKKRVGLMRFYLSDASLWLLDEPLVALDQKGIDLLMSAMNQHLMTGGHVILTSHQTIPLQTKDHREYCL